MAVRVGDAEHTGMCWLLPVVLNYHFEILQCEKERSNSFTVQENFYLFLNPLIPNGEFPLKFTMTGNKLLLRRVCCEPFLNLMLRRPKRRKHRVLNLIRFAQLLQGGALSCENNI